MNCYTTLLGTDNYVYGVMGLYRSLRNRGAQEPFKAIVVDTISESTLALLDECDIPYEVVENTPFIMGGLDNPYACTLNKFQFLNWTEYDKVMFLDADIFVMENPDELFNLEHECAASISHVDINTPPWYSGNAFILPPSPHLWAQLIKLQNSITVTNDEQILNFLIGPYVNVSTFLAYPYFFHDDYHEGTKLGSSKYWTRFKIDSIEKLNNFIDNLDCYISPITTLHYQPIESEFVENLDDLIINTEIEEYVKIPEQYFFIRQPK